MSDRVKRTLDSDVRSGNGTKPSPKEFSWTSAVFKLFPENYAFVKCMATLPKLILVLC